MRCLSLNGHVRDLLILEQSAPDPGQRERERWRRRRGGGKKQDEGILKGGWGVNENGEVELTRSTGPNWTLKDQIWEWGGIRRRGGPGIPPQVRAEAEQWIKNVRLVRTGGNQEENWQQSEGGLQVDPKKKVEIAWAGSHLKKGSRGQTRERILKR